MANDRMRAWLTRPGGLAAELVAARGALSMRNLADRIGKGWTSAKISKLEHGQQIPSVEDLTEIADALGLDPGLRATWQTLLDEAMGKRSAFAKRRHATTTHADNLALTLEAEASYIRATGPYLLPELLQTRDYARSALANLDAQGVDPDVGAKEIVGRQRILADLDRAFQFLVPESALRTTVGGSGIMAAQLDRLISAASMSNVQVAVLPQMEAVEVLPLSGAVTLYDLDAVIDDGIESRHYGAQEAARVVGRFDQLWHAAMHGESARRRILQVIEDLRGS